MFALVAMAGSLLADSLVLKASKDSFYRSNEHNRNSGASQTLYVAHASNIRSIIAFDLSGVTNRIVKATFRFRQINTMEDNIVLTIAPMVQTKNNAAWAEGSGALGAKGQNARTGESCYGWSAFPDIQWESAKGKSVKGMGDDRLWAAPIMMEGRIEWKDAAWIEVPIQSVSWLEEIRMSKNPVLTLGLWGTSGKGLYALASKESGSAPELVLQLEEKKGRFNETLPGN